VIAIPATDWLCGDAAAFSLHGDQAFSKYYARFIHRRLLMDKSTSFGQKFEAKLETAEAKKVEACEG
jgi:hypothetical protein